MTNLANKEKNLNELIEKLSNLSNSYSHDSSRAELLKKERDSVLLEKSLIEKKQHELLMEHKYLKDKILKLEQELKKKNELQDKFSREIDELSQETEELVEEINDEQIREHLYLPDAPDIDLIIRTSGESRLSGFLLWQSAYSEFVFQDVYWPEFRKIDFLRCLREYVQRERRFGK